MQIRFYIDEDAMSRALIRGLRSRGIDATTVGEQLRLLLKLADTKAAEDLANDLVFL